MFIDRKLRTSLVTSLGLLCNGTETEKRIAWWSESDGSVESTDESIVEEERVISKSRVCPKEWVGKFMCWVREKSARRFRKWEVYEFRATQLVPSLHTHNLVVECDSNLSFNKH